MALFRQAGILPDTVISKPGDVLATFVCNIAKLCWTYILIYGSCCISLFLWKILPIFL
jgi:hypothetical protein